MYLWGSGTAVAGSLQRSSRGTCALMKEASIREHRTLRHVCCQQAKGTDAVGGGGGGFRMLWV